MQPNLTAASNKQGNVRAELLQGGLACVTSEASPACLFAEERREIFDICSRVMIFLTIMRMHVGSY